MKNYNYRGNWGKIRKINLKIGFLIALSFVLFAFQIDIKQPVYTPKEGPGPYIENLILDNSVSNYIEKKIIPPVQKEVKVHKKEILEEFKIETTEEIIQDDSDLFESNDPEDEVDFSPVESTGSTDIAPIIEPIEPEDEDKVHIFAAQMPVFGDCNSQESDEEIRACSDLRIKKFIMKNLKYPKLAREIGLEGSVVAQFTIAKDGSVQDIAIVRELGGGTDEEVIRVLNKMPNWIPGKQNFRPVNVRITVPVKFALN